MLTVRELLSRLAYGEFKNLALPDENEGGVIRDRFIPMILNHADTGLIELGGKFILKQDEIHLVTVPPISKYFLRKEYAASNGEFSTTKYVDDSIQFPFKDDILRILDIFDECGERLPLNDLECPTSINSYEYDTLQVPACYVGTRLSIIYQAKYNKLDIKNLDEEIRIPFYLEAALQSYIAGKVMSNMNSVEASTKGQEHSFNYERLCLSAEDRDLVKHSRHSSISKLEDRGFQ